MKTDKVQMAQGGGGRETTRLIDEIFRPAFENEAGSFEDDAATLTLEGKVAFTTDSFVIRPLIFPGGDIGRLAVCGTVNDLLTAGARPLYLSAGFILEEGLPLALLERVVSSMRAAAEEAGVRIVTGDTKVIEGRAGEPGLMINTAGVGQIVRPVRSRDATQGDALIVTGMLGDHQACILSARMGVDNNIVSDTAPLCALVSCLLRGGINLHGMRDITRGGLATVLNEISAQCGHSLEIEENRLPQREEVATLLRFLGMEAIHMANEGNMLVIVPEAEAEQALSLIRNERYGQHAAIIGYVGRKTERPRVEMRTGLGGRRVLFPLSGEALPRIC